MTANDKSNLQKLEYQRKRELFKIAQEYRKEIREDIKIDLDSYHKIIAILSSIIPIFSIALINYLGVKNSHLVYLKISWVCFFLSLISHLAGLFINMRANDNIILNISKYYLENNENAFKKAFKIRTIASYLNFSAFPLFIIGIIILLIFLLISL